MLDASYLRLKNITLGYSMPQETLERIGNIFKGIRFYVTGTNLFTIKKDGVVSFRIEKGLTRK